MISNFKFLPAQAGQISNSKNGFTIIELIIIIGLITILPAIVISNFSAIKLQFALSRASYKFAQDLRVAQNLALSSKPYIDANGQEQLIAGYGVYFDANLNSAMGNKKYIIYADKNDLGNADSQYTAEDYVVSQIDFSLTEPGIIIKETANPFGNTASVNFSPPNPITTIYSAGQSQTKIDIVFAIESDLEKTKTVSINTSGLVEVK
ncbi:MAG: hypothetical protein AAB877_01065 [Patescibacteria group bacterium]